MSYTSWYMEAKARYLKTQLKSLRSNQKELRAQFKQYMAIGEALTSYKKQGSQPASLMLADIIFY